MTPVTNKIVDTFKGLPFENIIGAPLEACVKAQALAAETTIDFIERVGLNKKTTQIEVTNEKGEKKTETIEQNEAIYVSFSFIQGGRKVILNVPILAIVPIPYIAIDTIDIDFKIKISATENESTEDTSSESYDSSYSRKSRSFFGTRKSSFSANFSSKKDSKATQDSTYSVESTLDVRVHASQDSMPAGMARILEMLNSSVDTVDPDGELTVNDTFFNVPAGGKATLTAQYKNPEGLYDSALIKVSGAGDTENKGDKTVAKFELGVGDYKVEAGGKSMEVHVVTTA